MPDSIATALATPGLVWLVATALAAGVVYGFAGFGAALIFMPIATIFIAPEVAVAAFSISALASLFTVVPKAWAVANKGATLRMIGAAVVTAPLGIWILRTTDDTLLRWAVSVVVFITLLALITGWRYKGVPSHAARFGVGAATGFVGGATGLMGPIVVLFNLSGTDPVSVSRANSLVFLTLSSLALLPLMALQGVLGLASVLLGLLLLVPYGVGAVVGQALFNPQYERLYRLCAYGIIAVAVLLGLPIYNR
ncbi:sulfite exporter TauE/SafE family protein [Parasulfitobacter algicola]|uniref:Probable membrane transporter protein n=1 Tax=Parasulfitobacter algicola TaxID=2614809 RepID=A0ABX2ISA6_9RHOB|nr:sulfite exporter TauE/SafE family protein [Sulfitobacter algicola]NSX55190.1 sulfite exporter TauE/SafE family protein [Sulfitobacter algicola]